MEKYTTLDADEAFSLDFAAATSGNCVKYANSSDENTFSVKWESEKLMGKLM